MDRAIKGTLSTYLAPMIDQIRQRAGQTDEGLERFLLGEEDVDLMESGFALCIQELERLPEKDAILKELKLAADRLVNPINEPDDFEVPVYETVQEMLGLSGDAFQTLYHIGSTFFNEGKIEEAEKVFVFLTTLNNLVFDSWLGLGLCRQHAQKFPEALQAFSMASLIDFHHPSPHLFAAECYLEIKADRLAKESLMLALSKMDEGKKNELRPHISYINKTLQRRR